MEAQAIMIGGISILLAGGAAYFAAENFSNKRWVLFALNIITALMALLTVYEMGLYLAG